MEDALRDYGPSNVQIIKDRDSGKSKGFGFADVETPDAAIAFLNNAEWGGRTIKVSVARPKTGREHDGNGGRGRSGDRRR